MIDNGRDGKIIDDALASGDARRVTAIVRLPRAQVSMRQSERARVETMRERAAQTQESVERFVGRREGVSLTNSFWIANAVVLDVDTERVSLREIAAIDGVRRIHGNVEVKAIDDEDRKAGAAGEDEVSTDDDEYTYGLEQIDVPAVWDEHGVQGQGARVAVLDTGIDNDHPDLDLYTDNPDDTTYPGGWAEFDGDGDEVEDSEPHDTGEHGTHVSGTVAGGDAGGTHIGVAPECDLMHGLVLPGGTGSWPQIIAGIQWAVEEGADVINMSLGGVGYHDQFVEPLENTLAAGTLPVSASGNDGEGTSGSPANVYDGLSVGATDANEDVTNFSSGELIDTDEDWGDDAPDDWPDEYIVPDVAAPGDDVLSTVPGDDYAEMPGTSMAAPHVAGVAALIISAGEDVEPAQLQTVLEDTAWKPDDWDEEDADDAIGDRDSRYGVGIVDAKAAVDQAALDSGIEGAVTDDEDTPLEDVLVETDTELSVTTDEDGEYAFVVETGEYTVSTDPFGFAPESHEVTVSEDEITEQDFSLDPELDGRVVGEQTPNVEGGDTLDALIEVAHAETATVSMSGDYAEADADLTFDGESADFEQTVDLDDGIYEVPITVETTEDTSGEISLTVTLEDGTDEESVPTGSTTVHEEMYHVGVIDPSEAHGETIADVLTDELEETYRVEPADANDVEADPAAYDTVVVQRLPGALVTDFVETMEAAETGVVYLDQWGGDANAIPQFADESDAVAETFEDEGFDGDAEPPVYYEATNDHPIVDGISVGTAEEIHDFEYADHTWFELGSGAGFDVIADVEHNEGGGGSALAVDEGTNTVLASSLGYTGFVDENEYTDVADELLTNAVAYTADGELGDPALTSVDVDSISVGGTSNVEVTAENVSSVRIDGLWSDWIVDETETDGASFVDQVEEGSWCRFDWDSAQSAVSVSLTIEPPGGTYAGGTYMLGVDGAHEDSSDDQWPTFEIQ